MSKIIFLIAIVFILLPAPPVYSQNIRDNLTEEELKEEAEVRFQRKIENSLRNLSSDNYRSFEKSAFFFETMKEEAIPILVAHLKNNRDEQIVRINTIYVLGRLGKDAKDATPIVTSFLIDEDVDTRAIAAIALGKIGKGADDSVQVLEGLLNDKSEWVRKSAEEALRKIGTEKAKEALKGHKK